MAFSYEMKFNTGNVDGVRANREILIYDQIGKSADGSGVTAKDVVSQINLFDGRDEVVVRINSAGGSAFEGLAIAQAILRHPGPVRTVCESLCASAAVLIYLSGKVREIAETGSIMVHRASLMTKGNADDLQNRGKALAQLEEQVIALMADRTGQTKEKIRAMMAQETWLTPQEAIDLNFATKRIQGGGSPRMALDPEALDRFENVPRHILEAAFKPTCLADLVRIRDSGTGFKNPVLAALAEDAAHRAELLAKANA
ncbi:MAG: Clp protease ClpP [Planctomycetaceae bacterium]|nr:Clp protease ClpP [Planctomycetaceae bacterium]